MKSSLATGLSIVGVLTAGGAAMGLNTAVLTSKAAPANLAQQVLESAMTTVPGADVEPVAVNAEGNSITDPSRGSQSAPRAATTSFTIGSAGTVVVSVVGNTLQVVDLTTNTGWTASAPRYVSADFAKIYFSSSVQRLEVKITLVNGNPQVKVEDETGGTIPAPGNGSGYHDDDDDDDDDDDGEHRDDEHDDDEHDDEHDEDDDD